MKFLVIKAKNTREARIAYAAKNSEFAGLLSIPNARTRHYSGPLEHPLKPWVAIPVVESLETLLDPSTLVTHADLQTLGFFLPYGKSKPRLWHRIKHKVGL